MKLSQILKDIKCKIYPSGADVFVSGLTHKSDDVRVGNMFFCLKGVNSDGHNYTSQAIGNGATVIVSEYRICVPSCVVNVVVKNTRRVMSLCACAYFSHPSKDMKIVSITGTNGKTTTSFMIKSILETASKKVGVIGTNGIYFSGKKIEQNMTTPDPIFLQEILKKMRDNGVEIVVMEMSAHALELEKNWGIMTDIAVFTNLSQDHLDYFKTMEKYGCAKQRLFNRKFSKFAVLNVQDNFTKTIIKNINIPFVTYGINYPSTYCGVSIKRKNIGQTFRCVSTLFCENVELQIDGEFNVLNALASIAVCDKLGVESCEIVKGLKQLASVDGRFNSYLIDGIKFIIDFAHTPDSMKNVINSARGLIDKNNKIISVFGCGGNRDKSKRAIMGSVASELSDYVILTTDNPRNERVEDIIADIERGIKNNNCEIIINREQAIRKAKFIAKAGDGVLILGKGMEDYIEINNQKFKYSDREVLKRLEKMND